MEVGPDHSRQRDAVERRSRAAPRRGDETSMLDITATTGPKPGLWLRTLLAAVLVGVWPSSSQAQELPFSTLTDWQHYNNTGWMALERNNLDRAAQAFRRAVEVIRPYQATEPRLMARSNADFARVLYLQKRYVEAEPLARWALMVREKQPGDRSEAFTQNLVLLAQIEHARRRSAEAEPLLKHAVEVQEKELGGGSSDLTTTLEELADVQADLGKLGDSALNYKRALTLRDANHDANLKRSEDLEHRATAIRDAIGLIGGSASRLGVSPVAQAERFEKDARTARESSAESVSSAAATERHAALLHRAGRHEEAESLEVRVRAMRDAAETRAARARAAAR
jgi:tetratricopeptide (TPR) repeat protein